MKKLFILSMTILSVMLMSGCAHVQPNLQPCLQGDAYGFIGGFWHGLIAPFSFIASLFNRDVTVWAVNNTGRWYSFGFMLGIGALSGGSSSASKSRK